MRSSPIPKTLREARRASRLSQAALAVKSGAGRVTIARLEAGAEQDFRVGTLARLCDALGLELAAVPRGGAPRLETMLAREQARTRRIDLRRRHAALAARLLAAPAREADAHVRRARANVDRWERDRLCSAHYISRWRAKLAGPARRCAMELLEQDDWTDALLQNTPWGFALEPPAA
jgi:transcriptional regulator with XRE-family HTH domain